MQFKVYLVISWWCHTIMKVYIQHKTCPSTQFQNKCVIFTKQNLHLNAYDEKQQLQHGKIMVDQISIKHITI
jgi:hypothetical protein